MPYHFDLVEPDMISKAHSAGTRWSHKKTILFATFSIAIAWTALIMLVRHLLNLI